MSNFIDVASLAQMTVMGTRFVGLADQLQTQLETLVSDIDSVEAESPWGNDKFGRRFRQNYMSTPEGSTGPQNEALKKELTELGKELGQLGEGVVNTATQYQLADNHNAATIRNV